MKNSNNNNQTNKSANKNGSGRNKDGFKVTDRRGQPRKDNNTRRINADNTRLDKVADVIEADSAKPSANAIEDFNRNPELLRAAASIPFSSILGDQLFYRTTENNTVPGILSLLWDPNMGSGEVPLAWNKASSEIYSYIVHANSRTYAQDHTDYNIGMLAGSEVFCAIQTAKRVYGVMKSYKEENAYLVDSLVRSLGFNPKDLRRHLSDIWNDINDMTVAASDIWIPNVIPLFSRWLDKCSYVYTDAPGDRSQMYVFVRRHFFMFSGTGSEQGSCLVQAPIPISNFDPINPTWENFDAYKAIAETPYTWKQFKAMIYNMIEALTGSQDRGKMYGNIMNAYGKDRMMVLEPMTPDYAVYPVFNAEILMQIENVQPVHRSPIAFAQTQGSRGSIATVTGPLLIPIYRPKYREGVVASDVYLPDESVVNMHIPGQPTPEAIVEATRLKAAGLQFTQVFTSDEFFNYKKVYSVNGEYCGVEPGYMHFDEQLDFIPITAGSEIVTNIFMWKKVPGSIFTEAQPTELEMVSEGDPDKPLDVLSLMAFDWHPFYYRITSFALDNENRPATGLTVTDEAYGDYDNYTILDVGALDKLNTMCFYSLWGIPQSGFDHKYLA